MNMARKLWSCFFTLLVGVGLNAHAQETPKSGSWIVKDFKFHTGEVLPELRLNYTTLGDPKNEAVLILHGTTGSGEGMLGANFGGALFGPARVTKRPNRWLCRSHFQAQCSRQGRPGCTTHTLCTKAR